MRLGRVGALVILPALVVALGAAGCTRDSSPTFQPGSIRGMGEAVGTAGPRLTNVASLTVDASGRGTIQGTPTGQATGDYAGGTFELVLDPAPKGVPARTTLDVAIDSSTKAYRAGRAIGDPVRALSGDDGNREADPTAAATVKVRFRIEDGEVLAERLDLSEVFPADIAP